MHSSHYWVNPSQLYPSQGSNNVPVVPPQVGGVGAAKGKMPSNVDVVTPVDGVGAANGMMPSNVDVITPISKIA